MANKLLNEQHSEVYMKNAIHYLTDAEAFKKGDKSGLIETVYFDPPPTMHPVPGTKWLLHIYGWDVMSRLPEIKATITSTFGEVIKMDSTKKVRYL
jgi:hypothetical protein